MVFIHCTYRAKLIVKLVYIEYIRVNNHKTLKKSYIHNTIYQTNQNTISKLTYEAKVNTCVISQSKANPFL